MNLFKGRSTRAQKQYFMVPIFLLIAIALSYRFFFPSSSAVEHLSSYVMYPLLIVQNNVIKPVKLFFERQKSVEELAALLKKTEREREELLAKNVVLQSCAYYADQTRDLAEFKERYEVKNAHLAHILLRQFSDQSHVVFIDRGASKGVQPNMVALYKNCLIGRVAEVYPYYSKILLVTDKSCKIAAVCGTTKSSGIHEGLNKKDCCTLNYVSHLCSLEEGELVISSGEGLVFPQGFGLGKIKSFVRKGLFYDVVIEPLVDVKNIDYCYIMQKGE
jgi:rod shape-determining protein MreC